MKRWKYFILSKTCFPVTLGKEKHTSFLPTPPAILFSTTDIIILDMFPTYIAWYYVASEVCTQHSGRRTTERKVLATVYTYCTYLTLQWRIDDYTGQVEQILPPRSDNKCPIWYEIVTFINRVYLHNPGVKYCRVCSHLHFHPILGCCCTEYKFHRPFWVLWSSGEFAGNSSVGCHSAFYCLLSEKRNNSFGLRSTSLFNKHRMESENIEHKLWNTL